MPLADNLKALRAGADKFARRLGFGSTNTAGMGNIGGLSNGGAIGPVFLSNGLMQTGFPGGAETYDFGAYAGDLLDNSVIAAGVEAFATAMPDAPPILEKRKGNDWEAVHDHPALDALRRPNEYHSDADIWAFTVGQEMTRGQAFWIVLKKGSDVEIWPVASDKVRIEGTETEFISKYLVTSEKGEPKEFDNDEIIHFRHQLNPANPRVGWTPLSTGRRQVAGDNGAATYHGAILHNSGVMSLLIAVKEAAASGEITPSQLSQFVDAIKKKLFGNGAGGIVGSNLPVDVTKMSYSPDEMALDGLITYYRTTLCSLMGVDPMIIHLHTEQPTYKNLEEGLADFWKRGVVPKRKRHAATLTAQFLPLFGLDPAEWRVAWDYSNVSALQEDKDKLHARVGTDWTRQLIDKKQARQLLGYAGDEKEENQYEGVIYVAPTKAPEKPEEGQEEAAPEVAAKSWDESQHPRAENGEFGSGARGKDSDGKTFAVSRMKDGEFQDEVFRVGDKVKGFISAGKYTFGELVGISQSKREARIRVDGVSGPKTLTYDFGSIYKDDDPQTEAPKKKTVPLSRALSAANRHAAPDDDWTDADAVPLALQRGTRKSLTETANHSPAPVTVFSEKMEVQRVSGNPEIGVVREVQGAKIAVDWPSLKSINGGRPSVLSARNLKTADNWDETKHPRAENGEFGQGGTHSELRAMLEKNNLAPDNRKSYSDTLAAVCNAMPPAAQKMVKAVVNDIVARDTLPELRDYYERVTGVARPKLGGSWDSETGTLMLNGGGTDVDRRGVYAHELAHAMDSGAGHISETKEWKAAFNTEQDAIAEFVSDYAAISPVEAFAEIGRLMYGSDNPSGLIKAVKRHLPMCYAVWENEGLVPTP